MKESIKNDNLWNFLMFMCFSGIAIFDNLDFLKYWLIFC